MLIFRSEEEIDAWCVDTGEPRGEAVPLTQVWALAQAWYGDRMNPNFRGRTTAEALSIFAQVGLRSAWWQARPPDNSRQSLPARPASGGLAEPALSREVE
jgi:hypothetical protein